MTRVFALSAAVVLLSLGGIARANITIDTVTVGNPGNAADTTGYGSVSYTYNIGKYEVTAGQYTAFLSAVAKTDTYGLYNTDMWSSTYGCKIQRTGTAGDYSYNVASDWANRPVNYVSFWDSCRFANWLHNGQKTGAQDGSTTERGAYTLDGYSDWDGRTVRRSIGAKWAVTSEDEWYKAAYHKGNGTNANYWRYPTQSDFPPANQVLDPDPGNSANYFRSGYSIGSPYWHTNVGEFENSASAYGTFDQGGNVFEWNEAVGNIDGIYCRGIRGGSFDGSDYYLQASIRIRSSEPRYEYDDIGFRVVQSVPEPSSSMGLAGGLVGLLGVRRRAR